MEVYYTNYPAASQCSSNVSFSAKPSLPPARRVSVIIIAIVFEYFLWAGGVLNRCIISFNPPKLSLCGRCCSWGGLNHLSKVTQVRTSQRSQRRGWWLRVHSSSQQHRLPHFCPQMSSVWPTTIWTLKTKVKGMVGATHLSSQLSGKLRPEDLKFEPAWAT